MNTKTTKTTNVAKTTKCKYKIEDIKVGDLVIITEKAIEVTVSENIKNVPVRISNILYNTEFELEIQADDITDYIDRFAIYEIEKIITREQNPEYFL